MLPELVLDLQYDYVMRKQWDLSTFNARIEWLLHTRRLRQADLGRHLGRSSGNMSDVVSGKRELPWEVTAKMVAFLETNADFFLGLTEDDRPLAEIGKQEPARLYEESERIAQLVDAQPEWLRRQLLTVAQAQIDSVREAAPGDWDQRLLDAVRVAELTLGPDDADRLLAILRSFLGEVRSTVRGGILGN